MKREIEREMYKYTIPYKSQSHHQLSLSLSLSLSRFHHPTWIRLKWIPFPFINHTSKQFINWRLTLHLNLIGHCCSHQWLEMAITLHKEIFNITKMIWDLLLEVVHTKDDSRLIISSKVMSMFNNINDD